MPDKPDVRPGSFGRIVFALLADAATAPANLEELARLLAPHPLVIHHPPRHALRLAAPNVELAEWKRSDTSRNDWGVSEAVIGLLEHCLERGEFDYLQLLPPDCLPLRPIADFVTHLAADLNDAHMDVIDLATDPLAWMTYAYRLYAPEDSWRYRLLWRMHRWYVPEGTRRELRGGLEVPLECARRADGQPTVRARIARAVTHAARGGLLGEHPFGTAFKPWIGGRWFGARRPVCHYLVRRFHEPGIQRWFADMSQCDEVMFPSLLANSAYRLGTGHHFVAGFDGAHVRELGPDDLPRARASNRFFAYRFRADPAAPERRAVLDALHIPAEEA